MNEAHTSDATEQLARSRSHWRPAALALIVFSALLFCLSCVQIWGTCASLNLAQEAREETERMTEETAEQLRQMTQAREQLQKTRERLTRDATTLDADAAKLKRIAELEQRLRAHVDRDMERKVGMKGRMDELLYPRASGSKPAGHQPDKNCPAGLKRVVGED